MPIKVFNETFGRDETKLIGQNTDRSFGIIDVPSVEEFLHLTAQFESLDKQRIGILQRLEGQDQATKELSGRMVDREHAQMMVAEIKTAMADTSVFTDVLYSTLDAHEHRLEEANLRLREEVLTFSKLAEAAAKTSEGCLTDYRAQTAADTQTLKSKMAILAAMLKESEKFQIEFRVASQVLSQNSKWQAWGKEMQQGGLWVRLKWLLFGSKN